MRDAERAVDIACRFAHLEHTARLIRAKDDWSRRRLVGRATSIVGIARFRVRSRPWKANVSAGARDGQPNLHRRALTVVIRHA